MKHDIELSQLAGDYVITPLSMAGMMWLQLHFPEDEWDWLCHGASCLSPTCAAQLTIDAQDAGLIVLLSSDTGTFIPGFHD